MPILIMFLCIPMSRSLPAFLTGCVFYLFFKIKPKAWKIILIALFLCAAVFYMKEKKKELFSAGHRGPIWVRLIHMSNDRPIQGWGLGTLKYLLPINSQDIAGGYVEGYTIEKDKWRIGEYTGSTIMWNKAHNDYLQFLFEAGWMGLLLLLGLIGWIIYRFTLADKTEECLLTMAGLITIVLNMIETYPSTMIQLVPITVFLLAYFTKLTKKESVL
jgi:O-antigen ligase